MTDVVMTREVRQMRFGMALIGAQFFVPAVSYIVDPAGAVATLSKVDVILGGRGLAPESVGLWHMLAVGNVMTLAFLCFLLAHDVKRFLPALPALAFLKGFSSLYSLFIAIAHGAPAFAAVFVLDGATTVVMVALSLRAAWSLAADRSAPWWSRWLLVEPERIEAGLARVRVSSGRYRDVPNLAQVLRGAFRMWSRIAFRSETIGTSRAPVRDTVRARLLALRALRLPFLVVERAITPLDPSGLRASPEQIRRHLLAAHHDGAQFVYDLELLALFGRAELELLREEAADVVAGTYPRAEWLRDLCVHEGYHESLVAAADAALAGDFADHVDDADNPDITLRAFLAWCARQPGGSHAVDAGDAAHMGEASRERELEGVGAGEAHGLRGGGAEVVA